MDNIIARLYYDLLQKYPFSITGYPDANERLSQFFYNVSQHPIIKERDNIIFIIGLFASLESLNLENLSLDHVINWQTKPLKELYLVNYEGEYPDLILSFYLTLLSQFAGGRSITATNIIADNVRGNIGIRIKLTAFSHPSIHFIERDNVIEFRTPSIIFQPELWDKDLDCLQSGMVRRILQGYLKGQSPESCLIATSNRNNPHIFTIDRNQQNIFESSKNPSVDDGLFAQTEIFQIEKIEEIKNDYFADLKLLSKSVLAGRFKSELNAEEMENLISMALAGSFMAAYYDIDLDYVLSNCNVSLNEYFTLGGFAVGTSKHNPLTTEERALLSIISDHISANLSAQMAHDMFSIQFLKGTATYVLKKFAENGTKFHELIELESDDQDSVELAKESLHKYEELKVKRVISQQTAEEIEQYLNNLILKKENEREKYSQISKLISFSAQDLWSYVSRLKKDVKVENAKVFPEKKSHLSAQKAYGDFRWIKDIIKTAVNNLNEIKAFNSEGMNDRKPEISINIHFLKDKGQSYQPDQDQNQTLVCEIEDNGVGCDVFEIVQRHGGWGEFLNGTYSEVLNAHGNIVIESNGKKLDFLRPSNKKLASNFRGQGTKVTLSIEWS